MQTPAQIRSEITSQIISALEKGVVPWRRPWRIDRASGRHANATSKRAYSGINPILLELHALQHGLQSRFWASFQQWKALGCRVKQRPSHVEQGHWAARIVFYKPFVKTVVNNDGDEAEREFRVMRTFSIFNADQVEGEAAEQFQALRPSGPVGATPDFAPAEELMQATGAVIEHGGNKAFYSMPMPEGSWPNHTSGDSIRLPHQQQFAQLGAYYETAFHELAHWSEVRLSWIKQTYELCELVAEMSACFLATELGIPQGETLENHAAYLKCWLEAMKADTSFLFKAATQASKTVDFLMGFVKPTESELEPEVAQAN